MRYKVFTLFELPLMKNVVLLTNIPILQKGTEIIQ